MPNNLILIGLGNRARSGKDTAAEYIKSKYSNSHIIHFADALKLEARNLPRKDPLIYRVGNTYYILDKYNSNGVAKYIEYESEEMPFLHKIFLDRNIKEYAGMNGNGFDEHKDGEILQFWGTDFRRNNFGQDYWVSKTFSEINSISSSYKNNKYGIVLLPDTRFINEYNEIKFYNKYSIYVSVIRYNLDGSRYYDPNRDKNHPSEKELDTVKYDELIEAKSGDLDRIYKRCDSILEKTIRNFKLIEGYRYNNEL
jgi:hypothetical protein